MVFMDLSLKGKRAVVTAGAAGIGRAIADTLAKSGARVVVCDVDEQSLKTIDKSMHGLRADVSSVADVDRLFDAARQHLGGLDILVNNAGIAGPTGKVEDIDPADWDRCIAVDLNGMFYCTRRAMPLLKAAGGGSIINLSSIAGRFGFPLRTPYSAAKWAVIGFTQSIAAEAGPDGVRCNAIQPGIVEGDRVEQIMQAKASSLGVTKEEIRNRMVEGISLKTTVTAQDVADTIHFLVSDAGKHISAQTIGVCGGARYLV
jgi:NAD(P)-dependent dehydrogenase (short-subunit alcohol dehydrogenase family)